MDATNVGDIDLTTSAATSVHATSKAAESAASRRTSFVSAAASSWWTCESGFGLTILMLSVLR